MLLPAICSNRTCGVTWFAANPFGPRVSVYNVALGPCPRCGGAGYVPDGQYTPLGARLASADDVRKVVTALQELRAMVSRGAPRSEIDEAIASKHPRLEPLKKYLPQ